MDLYFIYFINDQTQIIAVIATPIKKCNSIVLKMLNNMQKQKYTVKIIGPPIASILDL